MAGLVFKSVVLPFRLLISISIPISLVYGLGVLVFQKGVLDSTNMFGEGVLKKVHALYWLAPIMSFSILVGLGLDYDIFLFSRIKEYRQSGFDDRSSIIKGVQKTGGVVTGAGTIMVLFCLAGACGCVRDCFLTVATLLFVCE
jgi:RND superfamily putative drug exporter